MALRLSFAETCRPSEFALHDERFIEVSPLIVEFKFIHVSGFLQRLLDLRLDSVFVVGEPGRGTGPNQTGPRSSIAGR